MNHENRVGRLTRTQEIAARIGILLLLSGAYAAHETTSPRPVIAQESGDACENVDGVLHCVGGGVDQSDPNNMGEASRVRRENGRQQYYHQGPETTTPYQGAADGEQLIADAQSTSHKLSKDVQSTLWSVPGELWGYAKAGVYTVWRAGYDDVVSNTTTVQCNGASHQLFPGESVSYDEQGNCTLSGVR